MDFRIGIFPLWTNHKESWMTDLIDTYYVKDSVYFKTCFSSRTQWLFVELIQREIDRETNFHLGL